MRRFLVLAIVVTSLGGMAVPASAVLRGENGLILFTSGRGGPANNDDSADLFTGDFRGLPVISAPLTTAPGQHRHATWSPDREKIVYARGTPGSFLTENYDVYVQDMTTGEVTPLTDPNDNLTADRPAWSPDGTKIAYEEETLPNDTGKRDIWVEDVANGGRINITGTAIAETDPAWDPISFNLYFNVGDPPTQNALDIGRRRADGSDGATTMVVADPGTSEFQPSVSPDGQNMCWTQGSGFNASTEIFTGPTGSPGPNRNNLTDDINNGDINCTFSPEGDEIAFVKGIFTGAALAKADFPDNEEWNVLSDEPQHFDGNPDWAPDGRPQCPNTAATTEAGQAVSVTVVCTDTGPAFEQSEVGEFVGNDGPDNGTVTQENLGDPIVYTPNPGFTGPDSFEVGAFDRGGFTRPGVVVVTVTPPDQGDGGGNGGGGDGGGGGGGGNGGGGGGNGGGVETPQPTTCAGRSPTITGTAAADTIRGTAGLDVILALGGADRIRGLRAGDIVCGGDGDDTIRGNKGADWLFGDDGDDVLRGGKGRDRLIGGAGTDVLRGGSGRDVQLQ